VPPPATVVRASICALSGMRANRWCPSKVNEWVAVDAAAVPCSWHHLSDDGLLVVWPSEYRQWAADQNRPAPSSPARGMHAAHVRADRFSIVSPPAGSTYLIDPTLRREFQTLPFRASGAAGSRVDWTVDGRSVGAAKIDDALIWPMAPGAHHVSARDAAGRSAEVEIMVK